MRIEGLQSGCLIRNRAPDWPFYRTCLEHTLGDDLPKIEFGQHVMLLELVLSRSDKTLVFRVLGPTGIGYVYINDGDHVHWEMA